MKFKNTYFEEHLWTNASENSDNISDFSEQPLKHIEKAIYTTEKAILLLIPLESDYNWRSKFPANTTFLKSTIETLEKGVKYAQS